MRTIIVILAVLFVVSLNINGEENKFNDNKPLTTVVIISARYGEDYKLTGLTYGQYKEIKTAIKTVNDLKKNKHIYGIDHYNAMFSTVLSGLKESGINVQEI